MSLLNQLRVLYVEDDDFIREELVDILSFDVKEIIVAKNGEEGLDKFKKYKPDIVISDVKMPKMNGLEMSKEIKNLSPATPIILTTAFSDSEKLLEAINIGIDRYILKPVDIDKLYKAIEDLSKSYFYEKEKEKNFKFFETILESIPVMIALISKEYQIKYINSTFKRFLGIDNLNDEYLIDFISYIEDIDGNQITEKEKIRDRLFYNYKNYIVYFKGYSSNPFMVVCKDIDCCERRGFIVIFLDITTIEYSRIKLLNDLNNIKSKTKSNIEDIKIKSKQLLMGEMVAAIAHQLKQPLTSISLHIQSLLFNSDKESIDKCIKDSLQDIEFMSETITEFRNFFRKDKHIQKIKVKDLVDRVLKLFNRELELNNIKIILDVGDEEVVVYSDFIQVLLNLIKNSKDAFEGKEIENKYIKISSYYDNEYVYIEVEDNAGGIDESVKDKLFLPNITTKKDGMGIGLYISKLIVDEVKGHIFVKSENGKTIFTIQLLKG